MEDAIRKALKPWPADRFPDGYEEYWVEKFAGYPADRVGQAIDALRMEEDPFTPTVFAVETILAKWGVVRVESKPAAVANYAKVRAEGQRIDAEHQADNALCESIDPADLDRLERRAVAAASPELRALIGARPARRFQSIRSMIAALARREGIGRLVGAR